MNDAYYTQTGERPDLAILEVNMPEGYIGADLMPISPVVQKTGTIYYATVTADAAAQTSRADGTAPTGTQISDSSTTFSALERMKRGMVTPDEAKTMGGIEKSDEVGAKWAKRQTMGALEASIASEILSGTIDATFDPAKVLTQMQTALQALRLYPGKSVLVGATATLKTIVQDMLADDTVGPVFARLVTGSAPNVALTGLNFQAWLAGLAMYFGIDEVKAGDDTIWDASGYEGRFTIMKRDVSGDELAHKYIPIFGKTFMFMPDGVQPYVIQAVADRVNVNNLYDSYIYYDTVALNAAALYQFDGAV